MKREATIPRRRACLLCIALLGGISHCGQGVIGGLSASGSTSSAGPSAGAPVTGAPMNSGNTPAPATSSAPSCNGPTVPAVPLQRLTQDQYVNTVRDLLGLTNAASLGLDLPSDEQAGAFRANSIVPIGDLGASQYMVAAQQLATLALGPAQTVLPCAASQLNAACVTQLITQLGERAYRRPFTAVEQAAYATLVGPTNAAGNFQASAQLVIEAMLQSPNFLYRVELAPPNAAAGTTTRLSDYELATRLSYFLRNSMPDDALLAAASAGQLSDPKGLVAQAQRLIGDSHFKDAITSFFTQWMDMDEMSTLTKDPTLYPSFNASLAMAMQNELSDFATYVLMQGDRKLSTLLTAPYSFLSAPLYGVYGLPQPTSYSAATASTTPVMLNPAQRAGLLTEPGFLAVHAHPDQTSPVMTGKVIRENFLCQNLPDPPPNVDTSPPPPNGTQTTRQRFAQHESDPVCGSCHQLMDPIGFGFGNYDAVGAFHTTEAGQPIDASGTILSAGDLTGNFNGAVDLATKLANSQTAQHCVSLQWLRFGLARQDAPEDACSIAAIDGAFDASGHDIQALIMSIVTSDAFGWRAN
jgi:hypothetical protein